MMPVPMAGGFTKKEKRKAPLGAAMNKQSAARKNCCPAFNAEQCVVYLDDIPTLSSKSRQATNFALRQRSADEILCGTEPDAVAVKPVT